MRAAHQAVLLQLAQVAPDGLLGDFQRFRKLRHAHGVLKLDFIHNERLAFYVVHVRFPPNFMRGWGRAPAANLLLLYGEA